MARPRTGDKRTAIVSAAIEMIATQGTSAATAKIAQAAGVSDGSFFTYFQTKDDLLNSLYVEIKAEIRDEVLQAYPIKGALRRRAQHLWDTLISWYLKFPEKRRALAQLNVSDRITQQSRRDGMNGWEDIGAMMEEMNAKGALKTLPTSYAIKVMMALAEATTESMEEDRNNADSYRKAGFAAFWNALT